MVQVQEGEQKASAIAGAFFVPFSRVFGHFPSTTPLNTPTHESRGTLFRVFGHFPSTTPKNSRMHGSRGSEYHPQVLRDFSCALLLYVAMVLLLAVDVVLLSVAMVLPNKETENSTTSVLGTNTVPLPLISGHKETQTILTALQNHFPVPFFGRFQLASPRTLRPGKPRLCHRLQPRKVSPPPPRKARHSRSTVQERSLAPFLLRALPFLLDVCFGISACHDSKEHPSTRESWSCFLRFWPFPRHDSKEYPHTRESWQLLIHNTIRTIEKRYWKHPERRIPKASGKKNKASEKKDTKHTEKEKQSIWKKIQKHRKRRRLKVSARKIQKNKVQSTTNFEQPGTCP